MGRDSWLVVLLNFQMADGQRVRSLVEEAAHLIENSCIFGMVRICKCLCGKE